MEVKKGSSQEGRTQAKNISETPRNMAKGGTGDANRGTTGPISFTTKKPRE
jgi:hypothetical protein